MSLHKENFDNDSTIASHCFASVIETVQLIQSSLPMRIVIKGCKIFPLAFLGFGSSVPKCNYQKGRGLFTLHNARI